MGQCVGLLVNCGEQTNISLLCRTCLLEYKMEEVKESQELEGSANDWNQINKLEARMED